MLYSTQLVQEFQKMNQSLTKIRIHKLLYFTYIEYYMKYGEELFKPNFQAWRYGPVEVDIYYNVSIKKRRKVKSNEKKFLYDIYQKYSQYKDFELVDISHRTAPWKEAYKDFELFHNRSIKCERIIKYIENL